MPPKEKRPKLTSHFVDTIIDLIESKELDNEQLTRISTVLGKSLAADILNESHSLSDTYKSDDFLSKFNANEWLDQRNPVLVAFVRSLTGKDGTGENDKKKTHYLCVKHTNISSMRLTATLFCLCAFQVT